MYYRPVAQVPTKTKQTQFGYCASQPQLHSGSHTSCYPSHVLYQSSDLDINKLNRFPSNNGSYYPVKHTNSSATTTNQDKLRQLPCKTFISVGTCPYRDRCVYLHDPRLMTRDAKTKTRRKNQDDAVLDSFFWPTMNVQDVRRKLDASRQPHVIQHYHVPGPVFGESMDNQTNVKPSVITDPSLHLGGIFHDRAIYSLWMFFTDFCATLADTVTVRPYFESLAIEDSRINAHTGRKRLQCFVELASGIVPKDKPLCQPVLKGTRLPLTIQLNSNHRHRECYGKKYFLENYDITQLGSTSILYEPLTRIKNIPDNVSDKTVINSDDESIELEKFNTAHDSFVFPDEGLYWRPISTSRSSIDLESPNTVSTNAFDFVPPSAKRQNSLKIKILENPQLPFCSSYDVLETSFGNQKR